MRIGRSRTVPASSVRVYCLGMLYRSIRSVVLVLVGATVAVVALVYVTGDGDFNLTRLRQDIGAFFEGIRPKGVEQREIVIDTG